MWNLKMLCRSQTSLWFVVKSKGVGLPSVSTCLSAYLSVCLYCLITLFDVRRRNMLYVIYTIPYLAVPSCRSAVTNNKANRRPCKLLIVSCQMNPHIHQLFWLFFFFFFLMRVKVTKVSIQFSNTATGLICHHITYI